MDAASFLFGVAVFDAVAVVPILLAKLGAPPALIGSTYLTQVLGYAVPAMIAAHLIHGRPNHKKFLLVTAGIGRLLIISLPFGIMIAGRRHPTLGAVWIMASTAGFWFFDGCCAVSWTDIVAKTVVPRARAFFFGMLQMLGGLSAIAAGAVVVFVLRTSGLGFPTDYAVLAACWAIGGMGSLFSLSLIREPPGATIEKEDRPTFWQFVAEGGRLFNKNLRVRTIVVARWLLSANGLALPFFAVYAQQDLGVPEAMVGLYIVVRSLGRILAGPVWGWASHRRGPSVAVRWVSMFVAAAPAIAVFAWKPSAFLMAAVFFMQGLTDDGLWTSCQNALYESVSDIERPLAVGAVTVALAPAAMYGVVGGVIVQLFGYKPAFVLAATLAACGAAVAWRLPKLPSAGLPIAPSPSTHNAIAP
jgi:hypothetical protein